MIQKRIARKSKKVKRPRVFNHAALTAAQWETVETLAAQPGSGVPLAERIGVMLRRNRSSEIPFDGSLPTGSGDESSEAARLGLSPEA